MTRIALITGITGQDGAYLAQFLLSKGYLVHGLIRRSSTSSDARLRALLGDGYAQRVILHELDITDGGGLMRLCASQEFHEVYHLAAQSHVGSSFSNPEYALQVDGLGTLKLLEALSITQKNNVRFYQASTSELFGNSAHMQQSESTPFAPRSPYACAKLYAYWITVQYQERGMFACNGILFNHESPLRGLHFVTRSITYGAARIQAGLQPVVWVGNLDAQRDWGYAPEYVQAMWQMLQLDQPHTIVVATGTVYTVRQWVTWVFACHNVPLEWRGTGVDEVGIDSNTGTIKVRVDPQRFRPTELHYLCGDATRARTLWGWQPQIYGPELARYMAVIDTARIRMTQETGREDIWSIPHASMWPDIPACWAAPWSGHLRPGDTNIW